MVMAANIAKKWTLRNALPHCVYGGSPRAEEATAKKVTSDFAKNIATLKRGLNEVDEKRERRGAGEGKNKSSMGKENKVRG